MTTTSDDNGSDVRASLDQVHGGLVDAMRAAWQHCERFYDAEALDGQGLGRGGNLPELVRSALEELGGEVGGTEGLCRHRPGSWEAAMIRDLAGMADHQ